MWFIGLKVIIFSIDLALRFPSSRVKREISSFLIFFYFIAFLYDTIVLFPSETEKLPSLNLLYIFST